MKCIGVTFANNVMELSVTQPINGGGGFDSDIQAFILLP